MAKTDEPFQKIRPSLATDPSFLRVVEWLRAEPDFAAHATGFGAQPEDGFPVACRQGEQSRVAWGFADLVPLDTAAALALLGLLRVWGAVYRAASGEVLRGLTVPEIDDLAGIPAIGMAMAEEGWAEQLPGPAVRFPGLGEWFGDGRASPAAIRMRRHRAKKQGGATCDADQSVTGDVTVTSPVAQHVTPVAQRVTPARNASVTEDRRVKIQDRIDRSDPPSQPTPSGEPGQPAEPFDPVASSKAESARLRDGFNEFWSLWPRKENQMLAGKKWRALAPGPYLVETILAAVKAWLPVWAEREPDHVPMAWGWLESQRWNDKPPAKPTAPRARGPAMDRTTELAKRSLLTALGGSHVKQPDPPG